MFGKGCLSFLKLKEVKIHNTVCHHEPCPVYLNVVVFVNQLNLQLTQHQITSYETLRCATALYVDSQGSAQPPQSHTQQKSH